MTNLCVTLGRAELVARDLPAVVCGDLQLSYAGLAARVRKLGGALAGLGLQAGDRVAVVGPNCHRYLELYLGVPGAAMALVPLNSRHTPGELRYALEDSGARILFHGGGVELGEAADCVERIIEFGPEYDELVAAGPELAFPDLEDDAPAGLFYTGGTTGAPKGVVLTHGNLVANAIHYQISSDFSPQTRFLIVAPMFHAAGTLGALATIWSGGRHIIQPRFDAAAALDLIESHRVTTTLVVPTMLADLCAEQSTRPRDIPSLTEVAHGGAPIATATVRRAHEAFPGVDLLHIYGATETSPIATLLPREQEFLGTSRERSCGQPAVGVEVRIVDAGGRELPAGEVGEIAVRGPNVTPGYWNKPAETDAVLGEDGWYRSGDLGRRDEEGYFFVVDRAKDMIVSGGENVYSTEVEDVIQQHPEVAEAAVFGVPDERWGEAVYAVVVPRGTRLVPAALKAHCRERIAGYKVPRHFEIRGEPLPRSGANKILKRGLRDAHWRDRDDAVFRA
jgi:long-chain acyl-CoA synthetase